MTSLKPRQRARRAWLAASSLVLVAACATEPAIPPIEEQLFGTWDWVWTEETGSGVIQTPDSVGFQRRLVITATMLQVLRDGVVDESARFQFVPAEDLDDEFVPPRLMYDQPILGVTEHGVGFDGAKLVLFAVCCGGVQTHVWAPVPAN